MTTRFELKLIVPAKLVGTIVELVEGEGILVSMTPHQNGHHKRSGPRHHEADMTADKLLAQYLGGLKSGASFTNKDVEKVFKATGYSPKTVSSRLSVNVRDKRIKRVGYGRSGRYEKV